MITLKDYARKKNVSYEAVRKQVNRYRDDLGDHLYKKDRTQYLDEEGEAFLDKKRSSNPIILVEHDKDEQIEELKSQNEALKLKIMQLQEVIIGRDDKIMELTERVLLLTAQPDSEETKEDVESEETPGQTQEQPGQTQEQPEQPDVQPLDTTGNDENRDNSIKSDKKWWQRLFGNR